MNIDKKPIRIIEIIGPAGSGKSTLANALCQEKGRELISSPPYYRRISDLPFFARNTLELLPTVLTLNIHNRCEFLSLRDLVWMVTLNGWCRVLSQKANQYPILILDEGPIFYMAFLQIYGSGGLNSPSAQTWWAQIYKQWSSLLAMVIYLDAPDLVLIQRIRERSKPHGIKDNPKDYAYKYLADLREKYKYLLFRLASENRTFKILCFDTFHVSQNQICSEITDALLI